MGEYPVLVAELPENTSSNIKKKKKVTSRQVWQLGHQQEILANKLREGLKRKEDQR